MTIRLSSKTVEDSLKKKNSETFLCLRLILRGSRKLMRVKALQFVKIPMSVLKEFCYPWDVFNADGRAKSNCIRKV